ncbi:unnamed protein product, partial [Oppiella nova]
MNISTGLKSKSKTIGALTARKWSSGDKHVETVVSAGGVQFTSISKTPDYHLELYTQFVAPVLNVSLLAESWGQRVDTQLPTLGTHDYNMENVQNTTANTSKKGTELCDHWPNDTKKSTVAHAKGVIAMAFGSYIVSRSLPPKSYVYPESGETYGQTALCITYKITEIDNILEQLLYMQPNVYTIHVSTHLKSKSSKIAALSDKDWISGDMNVQTITSAGGVSFTSFSKAPGDQVDLYSQIIAPVINTSLYVETWRQGAGHPLPSECSLKKTVENIDDISVSFVNSRLKGGFGYHKDHSKWAISKTPTVPYVCVGDLNRVESQFKRGGGQTCFQSPNGQPVDWYVVYKLPKVSDSGPPLDTGLRYAYLSSKSQSDIKPIYAKKVDPGISYINYNDHWPNDTKKSTGAHAKGVIATDDSHGFWLIHSVPKFATQESGHKYVYPASGETYGQTALCISYKITEIDNILEQLLYMHPNVYTMSVSTHLKSKSSKIAALRARKWSSGPMNVQTITSAGGVKFTSFGKAPGDHVDLYSQIMAPVLNTSLYVETWRQEAGHPLPSECRLKKTVENIDDISVSFVNSRLKGGFGYHKDHS